MEVKAVRKEDDMFYQGPFWIIGDSVKDIYKGRFEIVGIGFPVDVNGNYIDDSLKRKGSTSHKKLWSDSEFGKWNAEVEYDYFPRGRVRIAGGEVYIHINSNMNTPNIINAIVKEYNLYKFGNKLNIEEDDILQGSHYGYHLK